GWLDAWPEGRRRRDGCSVAAAALSGRTQGIGAVKACAVRRALCAGLLGLAVACSKPDPDNYQSVADRIMVIIPRGATYYQALDSLESRGVITKRDWFSLYARLRGLPSNLKSGVYTFDKDEIGRASCRERLSRSEGG